MGIQSRLSREVREWTMQLVFEHEGEHALQRGTMRSIAGKFGLYG